MIRSRLPQRKEVLAKSGALAILLTALAPAQTQNAVANGETRTISLYHTHSKESITATFRVNGSYDSSTLEKLNYFLRDWRNQDATKMDPRLFDVVWETYRESGSRSPIHIVSAYRSPATNAMLRRRSSGVAEFSQHMGGKAMDMHYPDVPMSRVREIAIRLQRGGVGYYPTSGTPFVHLDVGSVRAWPRLSQEHLARIFPDGRTVHLASNGATMARYDEARNSVQARNGVSVPTSAQTQSKGFFASLFGGGDDEVAAASPARGAARTRVAAANTRNQRVATPAPTSSPVGALSTAPDESSPSGYFLAEAARRSGAPVAAQPAPTLRGRQPAESAPILVARAEAPAAAPVPVPAPVRQPPEEIKVRLGAEPNYVNAPLPPRRPGDLVAPAPVLVAANVPVPPSRPSEFGRTPPQEAPLRVARAGELPSVITNGARTPVVASATTTTAAVLAYAPAAPSIADPQKPVVRQAVARTASASPVVAQPIGLRAAITAPRKSIVVASRLDRSNFRILTSPEATAQMTQTALGPAVPALRSAARSGLRDMIFAEPTNVATRFEAKSAPLPAVFSGAAVSALPRLASTGRPAQLN